MARIDAVAEVSSASLGEGFCKLIVNKFLSVTGFQAPHWAKGFVNNGNHYIVITILFQAPHWAKGFVNGLLLAFADAVGFKRLTGRRVL